MKNHPSWNQKWNSPKYVAVDKKTRQIKPFNIIRIGLLVLLVHCELTENIKIIAVMLAYTSGQFHKTFSA
jgi:hypothetical protein